MKKFIVFLLFTGITLVVMSCAAESDNDASNASVVPGVLSAPPDPSTLFNFPS
jgi:hypothetical protein